MLPPTVAPSAPSQAGTPRPGTLAPNPVSVVRLPLPPALKPAFSPWELLQALQRRWLLATVLGLLAATAAAAGSYYYHLQPEKKVATAQAYVYSSQPFNYYPPPAAEGSGEYEARLAAEAELAKSDEVIRRGLLDPELEKLVDFSSMAEADRIQWIKARLATYGNKDDGSVSIMLASEDHEKWLVPVVNALYRAYFPLSNQTEKQARESYLAVRNQRYMEHGGQVDLELKEKREKQKQQPGGGGAVYEAQLTQLSELLGQHQIEVAKLLREKFSIEVDRNIARDELGSTDVAQEEIQAELETDEELLFYLTEIARLGSEIARFSNAFSDGMNNPAIKTREATLKQFQGLMQTHLANRTREIRDTLAAKKEAELKAHLRKFDQDLTRNRKFLEVEKAEMARLTTDIKDVEARLMLHAVPSIDTTELEEKLKTFPLVDDLRKEVNSLKAELTADCRVLPKFEASGPPSKQAAPIEYRKISMAGGAALLAVLGCVSLLEYRTRRIHTAHEVVQGLGIRLLGAIPTWSPHSQQSGGYGSSLAYNLWTESVDTARTLVTHAAQAEAARVVMATSATSGEGKTSLASHLASSLARAGHRTLLVDADLRSPAIHALFDRPLGPGLCEVLRGQATVEDAIQETPARGLALLTAGQWDADALQALAQGTAHELFAQLKEQYDYVIVDSSPVLAVADAMMIGRHVDGVLLSILRDVSRVPTVYAAYQRLHMLGIRTLGAVVNGARSERYGSWYNAPPSVG